MKEWIVYGNTLPNCYHQALQKLSEETESVPCADWNTTQKEISMTMVVEHPLAEPMISKLFIGGPRELEQYRQEILDGILDFEVEHGNWTYTYHDRMVNYDYTLHNVGLLEETITDCKLDQIQFVIQELKRNPSSRRAVILIRDVGIDAFSDDPACLQHIQYFIRKGALHCKVLFRSNDACKAAFMNAFALILLQKRIADALGVPVGTYTHRANSFHCYEKDFEMLTGYANRIAKAEDAYDVCFDYMDGWDEEMEEAKEEIAELVKELKSH